MEQISRRTLLRAGGALGVMGAIGTAAPAWAWNTRRSVAGGDLETVPPELVWDPPSDTVVRRLFEEEGVGGIEELNALLRPWHRNDQPLPDGLPADLAAFLEEARQPPAWLDEGKLAAGFDFYETRGTYTGILYGLGSGMMSCAIPDEARSVYHSKGGEDMRGRVSRTAKLGYDIGVEDAFGPGGEMVVTCIKTRLAHSGVRHLITSSPRWQDGGDRPAPISQRDLIITWHSLATFIHRSLRSWKVPVTQAHADGFLHAWQVTAHHLGIEDGYIPGSWADAEHQSDQTLDPVIGTTPEGISLADTLLSLAAEYDQGLTKPMLTAMARYLMGRTRSGEDIADLLDLKRDPVLDRSLEVGWPWFVAAREAGVRFPGSDRLYWTFDEILRLGVLWGLNGGPGPIWIQVPTRNRAEGTYTSSY